MKTTKAKPMNLRNAQRECERRWGKTGCASERPNTITREQRAAILAKPKEDRTKDERMNAACSWRYTVGKIMLGMFNEVQGQGDSWEEAFTAADEKNRRDKEWYAGIRAGK